MTPEHRASSTTTNHSLSLPFLDKQREKKKRHTEMEINNVNFEKADQEEIL